MTIFVETKNKTMKNLPQDKRDELRKGFPAEAIGQNGSQKFLSSIKSIFIIERLNDVFGIGGWVFIPTVHSTHETKVSKTVWKDNVKTKQDVPAIYVVCSGVLTVPEYDIEVHQFGGDESEMTLLDNAFKGAATACLSKCTSILEIGIDVYKGDQSHESPQPIAPPPKPPTEDDVTDAQNNLIDCSTKDEVRTLFDSYPENFRKDKGFKELFTRFANDLETKQHEYAQQSITPNEQTQA